MKGVCLLFPLYFVFSSVFAQDTTNRKTFALPRGIYFTTKSFFAKKPDIIDFEIIETRENEPEYATGYGYTFKANDSVKVPALTFCFFDGVDLYVRPDNGERRIGGTQYFPKIIFVNEYFKASKLGRYAYIVTYSSIFFQNGKNGVAVPDSVFYKDINHLEIQYLSKKKAFLKATPDGIGFLLKADKDLFEAYGNEKSRTKDVMRKYLDKMNERYPDWEPSSK